MSWKSCVVALAAVGFEFGSALADDYTIDGSHTAVSFQISHSGFSMTHGRFNEVAGTFTIDENPAKSAFSMTIKAGSVDTNNPKRDEHLRSADFFNDKQFPTITFKSTSVKVGKDGLDV